ncbi:MAG TPA: alpha/beta hydrolase-fold protein [Armatimonadota bacterium]|nr:alpha/beta hydrolase-fold protein [Armatimonadota bacterium]
MKYPPGVALLTVCFAAAPGLAAPARAAKLTPETLKAALAAKPQGDDAAQLADQIRGWFGKKNILKGPGPKVDGLNVAWAIEAPGAAAPPEVVSEDGAFRLPLDRVGDTPVYAGAITLPDGAAMRWTYQVDNRPMGGGQLEVYTMPPEDSPQPGVPKGTLTQEPRWKSQIFPGTERDWWVYVPSQYRPETPAAVMIFQDGGGYKNYVPTVFDNLIAKDEIPVTVGIFINPGTFADGRSDRSFEYDTLSDQYSRFILQEILPEVEKTVKLRQDAAGRAIAGISSGGICAWTAAWQRPDQFSKVLSWVGSFTDIAGGKTLIEGGHNYPPLIRQTPPKPIRIFLQDGANDLDNRFGNWPLASQQMAKALAFAHYDYKYVFGNGFHSDRQGRALLPDALRWLWRP